MLHGYQQLDYSIKTEDFYKDIVNDAEKWFDTSNYDENNKRPPAIAKNKK